jgi:adenosylhomocysteine nucleosidase
MLLITPTQTEHQAVETSLRDLLAAGGLELATCGIGPERAAAFCQRLEVQARLPEALALVGVAGGLDPSLDAGNIILASAALDADGRRAPCTIVPLPGAVVGPVLTVGRALYTPAEKAAGRGTGALAVEMEAYPLAAWAAERCLPFIHARVILDPFGETLPDLSDILDDLGRARPTELLRHLISHPPQAASLARFLHRTRAIAPALGRIARLVVAASA